MLRFDPPLHLFTRYALEDVELTASASARANHRLMLAAANRDPARFAIPGASIRPARSPQLVSAPASISASARRSPAPSSPSRYPSSSVGCPGLALAAPPVFADRYHFRGLTELRSLRVEALLIPVYENEFLDRDTRTALSSRGHNVYNKLAAEAFGTFWLVFGGCGSAVLAAGFPEVGIGFVGVALAFGLTVLTMAYAVGPISGGHFNPAVTLGLAVGGRFSWSELVPYWIAQVVGGFVGAVVLYLIACGKADWTAGRLRLERLRRELARRLRPASPAS